MFIYRLSVLIYISVCCSIHGSILKESKRLFNEHFADFETKPCESKELFYLLDLKQDNEYAHVWFCLLKYNNLVKKPELLSLLGDIYNKLEINPTVIFDKMSTLLPSGFTKDIPAWNILGPFQTGPTEFDGDPIFEFGDIPNILLSNWNSSFVLYSELVKDGLVSWQNLPSGRGVTSYTPQVDWGDLVQSLQSTGVAEWQAWAVSYIVISKPKLSLLIRCTGLSNIYIDEKLINADLYHRDYFWFPITLSTGIHLLYTHLHGKGGAQFQCIIKESKLNDKIILLEPQIVPDLFEGKLFGTVLAIILSNMDSNDVLQLNSVKIIKSELKNMKIRLLNSPVTCYPGQYMQIGLQVSGLEESSKSKCLKDKYAVKLSFQFNSNIDKQLSLSIRCRKKSEAFIFSYVDHDGSIQHAGVVYPQGKCNRTPCPVVLSLHGTGVSAQSQAESYKHMKNKKYVFGFPNAWLLTPSRHGAHNWEGPGESSAISALRRLAEVTVKHKWVKSPADSNSVVFAGHSMGGHGAWQLAVHHPNIAIGVISASGWITKESYGDSNLFYRHDIALSYTDPATKSILEACTAENDPDKHILNLSGVPVHIRIGSNDKVVHPYFTRRMLRLLKSNGINVTYDEIKGKEHWWWDTTKENDGGVANDLIIRKFVASAVKEWETNIEDSMITIDQSCNTNELGDNCGSLNSFEAYIKRKPLHYEHVVYNPSSTLGMRSVRVLVQNVPLRKSSVDVNFDEDGHLVIKTVNVIRLHLFDCLKRCILWRHVKSIIVDGTKIPEVANIMKSVDAVSTVESFLCRSMDLNKWDLCKTQTLTFESVTQRGPSSYGPAARITTRPILIVVGTLDASETEKLTRHAVFLSNLFLMQSDLSPTIMKDIHMKDSHDINQYNLIILGGPHQNLFTMDYLNFIGFNVSDSDSSIWSLGHCMFSEMDMGFLGLVPHAKRHLALLMFGSTSKGFDNIMRIAWPTIPPMARSPLSNRVPDYVLTGPHFRARGTGGFLCSGFWNNNWTYGRITSSCTC